MVDDQEHLNDIRSRKGQINSQNHSDFISEAGRCLGCNFICNKCVEVCPNRANVSIEINSNLFKDKYQIIHLDALCNECGNCATFCPYHGAPYKEKITLYWSEEEFKNGSNDGFFFRTGTDQNQTMLDVRWKMEDGIIVLAENGEVVETSFKLNTERDEFEKLTELINSVRKSYSYLF